MKKLCCLLLVFAIVFSCCSCGIVDVKYEEGNYYVVLPISKTNVAVTQEIEYYINSINYDLLKTAEAEITQKCFPDEPEFSIKIDNDNYLVLSSQEFIVKNGYGHKHVWHTKRISTGPVK